ncbi:MAG TPA: uroporphyrinogen-III synthase [Bryobacteraceae bacterium]|nr:uroporphyrinogen-III synthase [Bryobacteraceae bacterium]
MSFAGRRVLSLESRRAVETAELIRRNGGDPFVAPSMREVPIEHNQAALRFAERLLEREFDMVILLTGVGTRFLVKVMATRYPQEQIVEALAGVVTVARGPKPTAALREIGLAPTILVPEPNTWHEIVAAVSARQERRIAVQEYGKPSTELHDALRSLGAEVTPVPVYQWDLPEDVEPLKRAASRLAAGEFDVTLWTTSTQLVHLLQIAEELGIEPKVRAALQQTMVASIGPTTSETLTEHGLHVDMEPSHPKLGLLVKEAAEHLAQGRQKPA